LVINRLPYGDFLGNSTDIKHRCRLFL